MWEGAMSEVQRQKCLQSVTRKLVVVTAGCLVFLAIFFYAVNPSEAKRTYLVSYVFMAGLIGGFVSIQQRLPSLGLDELRELSNSWFSILLIPINGGVFALVLMILFLSGILEGSMFPRYTHSAINHEDLVGSFALWLNSTFPQSGPDIAKLLFWSFVAGFSERLVPQIIRSATQNIQETRESEDDETPPVSET